MKLTSEYSKLGKGILYTAHNYENPTGNEGSLMQDMRANIKKAFLNLNKADQKDAFFNISRAIETNSQALKKATISTADINAILEEIRNTEIYLKDYEGQEFFQINNESENIPCHNNDIIFLITN